MMVMISSEGQWRCAGMVPAAFVRAVQRTYPSCLRSAGKKASATLAFGLRRNMVSVEVYFGDVGDGMIWW